MKVTDIFKRGTLGWSLLAFILIVGAMLVPIDWVRSVGGIFGATHAAKVDAFSDEVAAADTALEEGAPLAAELLANDGQKLEAMRPLLQVRRLTRTGAVSVPQMSEAADIFREFNPQIANQTLEGSSQALRRERNRRVHEVAPHLDIEAMPRELETLRQQIAAAKQNPRP